MSWLMRAARISWLTSSGEMTFQESIRPSLLSSTAPFAAAGVEPAILVGLAGEGGVDLGVDLDAVLVIGPDVDVIVAVAVEEAAEEIAFLVLEDPAAAVRALDQLDLAAGVLVGGGRGADDTLLPGFEGQHLGDRGGRRRRGRQRAQQQTTRQPTRSLSVASLTPFVAGVSVHSDLSIFGTIEAGSSTQTFGDACIWLAESGVASYALCARRG